MPKASLSELMGSSVDPEVVDLQRRYSNRLVAIQKAYDLIFRDWEMEEGHANPLAEPIFLAKTLAGAIEADLNKAVEVLEASNERSTGLSS